MRYDEYLQSDEWKARRAQARKRAKNRCEHCGGPPDHVHHVRYPKNFKDDILENLIVVCESCHMKHHGIRGEYMTSAITVSFSGETLTVTDHGGEKWVRFKDVEKVLGLECAGWLTCKKQLTENIHWVLKQNPFSLQLEVFLSPQAVLVVGMRFGMNQKAEGLRWKLAEMATNKPGTNVTVRPGNMGSVIRHIGEAIESIENEIENVKAQQIASEGRIRNEQIAIEHRLNEKIEDKMSALQVIVDDYMRASDFLRGKNSNLNESAFGKFLSAFVRHQGGFSRADVGWFSKSGEQLSKRMPAPDTQYRYINKWKKSLLEQAWPFFQKQAEINEKANFFHA